MKTMLIAFALLFTTAAHAGVRDPGPPQKFFHGYCEIPQEFGANRIAMFCQNKDDVVPTLADMQKRYPHYRGMVKIGEAQTDDRGDWLFVYELRHPSP